jgi:hypothetical protein
VSQTATESINRDRVAVYTCDGCGDLQSAPGPCARCQAPLGEDVAAQAWLATLMSEGEVIQ